jgi:formyl-CoA transferase
MSGVLEGVRVLDLAVGWAGPSASMYLADQGADVIKVEPPEGDLARGWYPSAVLHGTSRSFLAINRNKRGMALDLTTDAGRAVLHRLVERADIAISNALPEAAARRGLDYATLSSINPRIIYGLVTGYGARSPYANEPAYDQIIQGLSGAMARRLPDGTPLRAGVMVSDTSAPMLLAYGIALALLDRERTGAGQLVETTLMQAAIALQSVDLVHLERDPEQPPLGASASTLYRCADGRYINVLALTERQIVALFTALGLEQHLEGGGLDAGALAGVQRQWRDEIARVIEALPGEECLHLLRAAGVPCGPVLSREEVFGHEQVLASGALASLDHSEAGRISIAGIPVELGGKPGDIRFGAPELGEHTDAVLLEHGFTPAQVASLRERRVVG